jgi:HAD superfamily hydrolase (TIGR01509 family)
MAKAVLFDRDGVLIDSESVNVEAGTKAFKKIGISITEKEKELIIGKHPHDYCVYFLKKYKFSYDDFRNIQRELYYQIFEKKGEKGYFKKTIDLAKKLHKNNILIGLTTSSSKRSTDKLFEKIGLNNLFDVTVTFEDYTKRKPDPEPYIVTAKRLGVSPSDCVAIEDTAVGLASAKSAGMKCIIIPNVYTKHQDFSKADLVVESADELTIKLLKEI